MAETEAGAVTATVDVAETVTEAGVGAMTETAATIAVTVETAEGIATGTEIGTETVAGASAPSGPREPSRSLSRS